MPQSPLGQRDRQLDPTPLEERPVMGLARQQLRKVAAVLGLGHNAPRPRTCRTAHRIGQAMPRNVLQAIVPSRTSCHQWTNRSKAPSNSTPIAGLSSRRSINARRSLRRCDQKTAARRSTRGWTTDR
jgi:hypothetical protein